MKNDTATIIQWDRSAASLELTTVSFFFSLFNWFSADRGRRRTWNGPAATWSWRSGFLRRTRKFFFFFIFHFITLLYKPFFFLSTTIFHCAMCRVQPRAVPIYIVACVLLPPPLGSFIRNSFASPVIYVFSLAHRCRLLPPILFICLLKRATAQVNT